jgi:uncharacterized lipoprotein YmbA
MRPHLPILAALLLAGCATPPPAPTRDDLHALRLRLNAEHGSRYDDWPAEARAEWDAAFTAYISRP